MVATVPSPHSQLWRWEVEAYLKTITGGGGGGGAATSVSDTPPPGPTIGQLWYESDSGNTFLWYEDPGGPPGQWVQVNVLPPVSTVNSFMNWPAGCGVDWWGQSAPEGTLFCYGQSLSRTTYAALFAAIGTAFGNVDAASFNAPDCRGRLSAGRDDMGGSSAARLNTMTSTTVGTAGAGGAQTHALTEPQLPAHSHVQMYPVFTAVSGVQGGATFNLANTGSQNTSNTGSNVAHNNIQPTIICNKLITTGGV